MEIILIAAVDKNFHIGYKGNILWNNPLDRRIFKHFTIGNSVIMGRKTFESIGKPLVNRENIVLSRSLKQIDGCKVVSSEKEAIKIARSEKIFIIGGESIYKTFMPIATKIYLSIVDVVTVGDRFFPYIDKNYWELKCKKRFTNLEFRIYETLLNLKPQKCR